MKNSVLLLSIIFIAFVLTFLSNRLLVSDTIYYNSFAEQLATDKIEAMIEQTHKWWWLAYTLTPIVYVLKFSIIALILFTGFFFVNRKVSFSLLFKTVMLAEIPFFLVPLIKLFWFLYIQTNYTLQDLQFFYPFSALQLFDVKNLPAWQVYPLQLLNVFELVYWVSLAYWLKRLLHITLTQGMEVVMASYGTGLVLWIVFITFLSLNLT